ncbi:MAG: cation:proton antiporter [Gammaproteobacteria bacterium]
MNPDTGLTILESTLIVLAVVVFITTAFRRLNIPTIVGYIFVGILVGPDVFHWLYTTQDTRELAEYGIVFLLFTIGLEFSLSRLIAMRSIVFGLGALQVIITILVASGLAILSQIDLTQGIIIGAIFSMSSTAIVTKQLTEQLEMNAKFGMQAVGILLFQDLAVVPLLILIPYIGVENSQPLLSSLLWSILKGAVAVSIILVFGRYLLKPIFYQITKRYSFELLTLSVLLVALSAGWLTYELGLSAALGAFLAGIMLGETEFRHQIEVTISPFRDVLLALFFISVGMQLNLDIIVDVWFWVLLSVVVLILMKTLLIYLLGRLFGNERQTAFRTGLVLAQGGEFAFVLLLLAAKTGVLAEDISQVILATCLVSMLISPILIQHNNQISKFIFGRKDNEAAEEDMKSIDDSAHDLKDHVVICGYGRVGQYIARMLIKTKVPFIAFDLDPQRVQEAKLAGEPVFYADASHYNILHSAQINRAKVLAITFENTANSLKILQSVRAENKRIPILIRSRDDNETHLFYSHGATEVMPELIGTSLNYVSHILLLLNFPVSKIRRLIDKIRQERYALLHGVFPTYFPEEDNQQDYQLHVIVLSDDAYAVGRSIAELGFNPDEIKIVRVRRGAQQFQMPADNFFLQANDVIVLYGVSSQIEEKAEKIILEGLA